MNLPARLLVVTDRSQARLPLADIIAEACAAGCRWISLREKDLSEAEQIGLYRSLASIARPYGSRITIHGSAQVAQAAGADGVHLSGGSDVAAARALLGPDALVGISVHHANEAAKLAGAVDYVIAGPVHLTASKPGYGPALGASGLSAIVSASAVPVIAIGGLAPDNIAEAIAAGAAGVAVMGSVMRSATPGREITRLMEAVDAASATYAGR